jgi:outer membrane lipoprotein SlyB
MISMMLRIITIICALLFLSACGAKRPVFYPNDHFKAVGNQQARTDADQCMADAKAYGTETGAGKKVGGRAVKGAAVGAVASTVVSAVLGGNVLRSAGAGAAGGAAVGATSGAIDANDPDQVFKNFVQRCLQEKGYEVVGWK